MLKIKKILVPTDFNEESIAGIKYAVSLAREHGAKVIALHVIDKRVVPVTNLMPADEALFIETNWFSTEQENRHLVGSAIERGQRRLFDFLEREFGPELPRSVTLVARVGDVAEEIVDVASSEGCDLIVMASKGKGWLTRTVAGSMSEAVAREAPCPVITIQPEMVVREDGRWVSAGSLALGVTSDGI
jgi:nucleotide-binding universal stress UspA family protein